jgi:hypothetical protein
VYSETLKKFLVPMTSGNHPELHGTAILNDDGHKKYQMLIRILNWIVTMGRLDVCHGTSSLARFMACPRQKASQTSIRYFKKPPNRHIIVNSRDPTFLNCETDLKKDYVRELEEAYPDVWEEVDANVP